MVLSYTTSPAYHRHIESSERYRVAMFDDGHYQQVEVVARLASSKNPMLAQDFLSFMLSDDVQKILPTTNWMLPAVKTGQPLPEAFKEAERQVDEVVRVLAPGPLVTPLDETETRDAEEAVRQATRRWKEKQGGSRER